MKKHISPSNNLKNLNLIINSDTYKLAHEDIGLLSRNEMRGVRMLLEITKPDLILEENKILSTIIIFGGASITEESNIKKRLENIEELIKKNPKSILLKRNLNRLENLLLMSHYYQSAREFSKLASISNQNKNCNSHVIVTSGGPGISTETLTMHSWTQWRALDFGGSSAVAYTLLFVTVIICVSFFNFVIRKYSQANQL